MIFGETIIPCCYAVCFIYKDQQTLSTFTVDELAKTFNQPISKIEIGLNTLIDEDLVIELNNGVFVPSIEMLELITPSEDVTVESVGNVVDFCALRKKRRKLE